MLLESEAAQREILGIRHSLYAPRDFDISPYFKIVKPTLVEGLNYKMHALGRPCRKHHRLRLHRGVDHNGGQKPANSIT
jgi:hypothetical protein